MRSSRPVGHLLRRHRPEPHGDLLVHRQLTPHVADGEHPVESGVRDEDHAGVRRRVHRREQPAGPGRQDVAHPLGALRHPVQAALAQPFDRPDPAARREVAALREDHERVVLVEADGEVADVLLDRSALAVRRDEPVRQPVEQHVDRRVPLQHVLEHDPRLAVEPVDQRVDEHERVARAGVPAHHELGPPGQRGVRVGADDVEVQPQRPPRLPEQERQEPAGEHVVGALEGRRTHLPAEAGAHPEPEQRDAARRRPTPRRPCRARSPAAGAGGRARAARPQRRPAATPAAS